MFTMSLCFLQEDLATLAGRSISAESESNIIGCQKVINIIIPSSKSWTICSLGSVKAEGFLPLLPLLRLRTVPNSAFFFRILTFNFLNWDYFCIPPPNNASPTNLLSRISSFVSRWSCLRDSCLREGKCSENPNWYICCCHHELCGWQEKLFDPLCTEEFSTFCE